ncbi:FkbM family methyltransferase [Halomarina pelagica]|uniref:FkbM family methyltransferase n=1 Tax=Halomarina pelagica TaxID=2961599 RepID=UPI0020C2373B|nr:FkbM family methyltransferase [Halomarina sp. BND7]
MSASGLLLRAKDAVHTERVDRLLDRLGVRSALAVAYRTAVLATTDTRTLSMGGATATFHMDTVEEFRDLHGFDERAVAADLVSRLRPDDVVYDVGANLGIYTCLAADVVDTVIAFEPHPENAARLADNVDLNDASVVVSRYALSDAAGVAELAITLEGLGSAGHTLLTAANPDARTVSVETRRGDDLVAAGEIPPPTVVKVDAEGAELSVLRGLRETLSRPACRLVYCEVHESRLEIDGASVTAVRDLLRESGFDVSEESVDAGQRFLVGRKE